VTQKERLTEREPVIHSILDIMASRQTFLVLSHKNPDEDAYASCVSVGLILSKFQKQAMIYLSDSVHEHFQYLMDICRYNSIDVVNEYDPGQDIDSVIICDTPKYEMVDLPGPMGIVIQEERIPVIEIDHHLGADSRYIGSPGLRLVDEASSTCELIGHMLMELESREDLLETFQIENPFTRNVVLTILTGIIGDTNMGQYLKSDREREYYDLFSEKYNAILARETTRKTNFSDRHEVFSEIRRLSKSEKICRDYFEKKKRITGSVGYVTLDKKEMEYLDSHAGSDDIVSVARSFADSLAEEAGKVSMISYYDYTGDFPLVQFRVRRSAAYREYDLRNLLEKFSIENGGGHEGAIGFRFPAHEVEDYRELTKKILDGLREAVN
jgi:nanoRNase/pAp phosphatase (c-di-AMP/oligoRNAs hydrolase)